MRKSSDGLSQSRLWGQYHGHWVVMESPSPTSEIWFKVAGFRVERERESLYMGEQMQKNGADQEEVGDAGGSSVEIDTGDCAAVNTVLDSNGDSRLQVVVSDGDQLSLKKPQLSRTPSSHDECRFRRFSFYFFTYLISFPFGVSLMPSYNLWLLFLLLFCSSCITTYPIPRFL